jgi:hypothetical protein
LNGSDGGVTSGRGQGREDQTTSTTAEVKGRYWLRQRH